MQEQQQSTQPPPSLSGEAIDGVAEPQEVILEEYWKTLPVTKALFSSKVEASIQRSVQLELELAELQNEDTPIAVLKNADDNTSDDENERETSIMDLKKKHLLCLTFSNG